MHHFNLETSMSKPNPGPRAVVFVHGLWLHAESWHAWVELFRQKGYHAVAASWPGDAATTVATRQNPASVAGYGVNEIAEHIARQLKTFDQPPVLVGHSFCGLLVQKLLGLNLAAGAIAIDPAPIKGVPELPLSALKSALPVLCNPFNLENAVDRLQAVNCVF
jgi:alpha-beta hydrolase superfamily lysophospholipase